MTVSKKLWDIWHGDKTLSRIIFPPNDVLFYQSWSFKMTPKRVILCLQIVSVTTFLIIAGLFGQIFVKMEGFATSFCNFWQISSDKICTNWVAKFIIKGGCGNFVQIGVSCLRGPSMTIAVLGNNPYYHPSNVKFKITHLHFTQCPLSLPDCLILTRDTGHLFSFGNKFLGNTSPSTATL